jgi:hypothetical protein
VDFDPPPSASGNVAPELSLARPKKLRTHGKSTVPDERKESKTQEAKTLIIPDGVA